MKRPVKTATLVFLCSSSLLSLEVKPKLTSDSETDVTTDRHEHGTRGMRNVPVHAEPQVHPGAHAHIRCDSGQQYVATAPGLVDRKSTRLNSSHRCISYAVFCLKKKT